MKLNKQGKDEIRKLIEEKIKDVPNGKRIHLDKEILEDLLFDEMVYNKESNGKLKLPKWSGDFLSKIDLSEVSFEDVSWRLLSSYPDPSGYDDVFDEEAWNKVNDSDICQLNEGEKVNYSNTNAKIDFTKSFEYKQLGKIKISECNFSGVDLSKNDMSKLGFVADSDLSNTKMVLSPEMFPDFDWAIFSEVNLSNVDFSKFTINGNDLLNDDLTYIMDPRCNLANTGINIVLNVEEINSDTEFGNSSEDKKKMFKQMLHNGYLVGCYVNGKKVHSSDESENLLISKKDEYEKMKQNIINNVSNSIDEQIGKKRK